MRDNLGRFIKGCKRPDITGEKNPAKRPEVRKKLSLSHKGIHPKTEFKKGHKISQESKRKMSLAKKKAWADPKYQEKQRKLILKGLMKRPTCLEKQMIQIIERNNLPFKYVGDGNFILAGKNPDFINCNGEKIAIEVYANCWKKIVFKDINQWKEDRQKIFGKYGWKIIFFDEDELKNEEFVLENIKRDAW